jgi:phosphoglycerate dehydrogenase-like enzyme
MKIFMLSPNAKTLFTDSQFTQLKSLGEFILVDKTCQFSEVAGLMEGDEDRILAIDPDFCEWKLPGSIIDQIPNLKAIVLQTTSFSWVDTNQAKKLNIPVVNLRGFSSIAVAEWATMITMNLARKIPVVYQDKWIQDLIKHKGIELRGKVAGVIGLGRIGSAIAENLSGLGMDIQYYSVNSTNQKYKKVSLDTLMQTSDVILPVVAQNEETKGMITDDMLKSMKKTVIFVSIVHKVYNHELLLELAKNGDIFGYGFETGKPEFGQYPGNVWAGPELAWCTEDSLRKNSEQWLEGIAKATQGEYTNKVN